MDRRRESRLFVEVPGSYQHADAEQQDIMFGAIDVGTEEVESADVVAARLREALEHVPAERLYPCTDCGLVPRSRAASRGKMRALAEGAAIVRAELTSSTRRALTVS